MKFYVSGHISNFNEGIVQSFIVEIEDDRSARASWAWALALRFSFTCCAVVTLMSLASEAKFWFAALHAMNAGHVLWHSVL